MFNPARIRPPHYLFVLLVLASLVHFIAKPAKLVTAPYHWIGLFIALAGFCFMGWAHQLFGKNKTPVRHSETPAKLVLEGPYRFTRNPMYVGGLIMFAGIGLFVGTWPFLFLPLVLLLILNFIFIPFEEKTMAELFKDEYCAYTKKVRRWL